jgi:hypothetical protein
MGAASGEFVKNVRRPPSVPRERRTGPLATVLTEVAASQRSYPPVK